jgi:hypothetical protein
MATLTPLRTALIAVTLLTASNARAEQETPIVVVHVENHAQVSGRVLREAEWVVDRIYAAAGIRIVWVDGGAEAEPLSASLRHLRVLLLSEEMTDSLARTEKVAENVMGQAEHPVGRAYVLYPRLEDIATRKWVYVTDLLGKVMAHEIGHLLLTTGHSSAGIMRPGLQLRPVSQEHFTAKEALALRRRLSSAR